MDFLDLTRCISQPTQAHTCRWWLEDENWFLADGISTFSNIFWFWDHLEKIKSQNFSTFSSLNIGALHNVSFSATNHNCCSFLSVCGMCQWAGMWSNFIRFELQEQTYIFSFPPPIFLTLIFLILKIADKVWMKPPLSHNLSIFKVLKY